MSTSTKTWTFLLILSLLLMGLGHYFMAREGVLWGLVLSLGLNSFIYFYSDRSIVGHFSAKPIEGQDPWGIIDIVRKYSEKVRVTMPKVHVIESPSSQVFSVGRSPRNASLIVTEGLLESTTPEELEAIIAYQLASIKRCDTLAFSVGSVLISGVLFFTSIFDALLRWIIVEKKDPQAPLSHAFTFMAAPLIGFILKFSVNTKIYFDCDALAASYLTHPRALAEALWKLQSYATTSPFPAPPATAHLFMVNPLTERGWTRYFQAQPSVERRIRKLVGYYPI